MNTQKMYKAFIYFFGALGGLLFGYDTGVVSGAILFIREDLQLTPFLEGLVVSGVMVGAILGASLCGPIADKFGRKKVIILLGFLFSLGALGTAITSNINTLVTFRIELGVAVGGASGLVPLYLTEIAPANIRGRVTSLNTLMNALGILLAYIVNNIFAASGNWHWMLGLAVVPSAMLMVGMIFMPESPRWLLQYYREDEARRILLLTREESHVDKEIASIKQIIAQKKGSIKMLFTPSLRPILIAGIGLAIFQQAVGTPTIVYYTPSILKDSGLGSSAAIAGTLGIGVVNVLFTLLGMALVDNLGRKKLLLMGNIGMSASLIALGVSKIIGYSPGWLLISCLCIFMVAFSSSWGMVVWIVLAEIFPLKIRGAAMGLCSTILWLFNAAISLVFPSLLSVFKISEIFLIFGIIGILAYIFVYKLVPETKGRSLEEIERDMISINEVKGKVV